MNLPNQATTWGRPILSFDDWKACQPELAGSEPTLLALYLVDHLKVESADIIDLRFNHPIVGLLAHLGERDNRAQELLYAYLALTVAGDAAPARALVAGRRLKPNLHPDYVAKTRCYDAMPSANECVPWAQKLVEAVRKVLESGIPTEDYSGYPSPLEGFLFELHGDLPYGRPAFRDEVVAYILAMPEYQEVNAQFQQKYGRPVLTERTEQGA